MPDIVWRWHRAPDASAGGLRAKERLSFKAGVFGAIEPLKTARRTLWDKKENSMP